MRAPAWWRRFRAWLGGYFWLPCPRCGKMFAGYEKRGGNMWWTESRGAVTCPECPGNFGYGYGRGGSW